MCAFTNKTALVTGAAGGIGAEVVLALARQGATVAAVDRDAERLCARVDSLTATGLRVSAFPADVTSSAAVEEIVDQAERNVGPLDCLVNAAGVLRPARAEDLTDEDWRSTFAVNVDGVFHVSRAVARRMKGRKRGAIVTIASNAAGTPRMDMAAYAASKAAATMFTKTLGLELAGHGIRCNVVAPGSTDTQMLRRLWVDESGRDGTLFGAPSAFRVGIPLGKLARPEDVADAVIFLLSERAAHITMQDLTVDGGATLGV
jgi:2,3-dihydro-2,3-dihydroxybenzoate dehydrogenase